ncbi:MAG: hypothetical protein QXZ57_07215 [Nitrososphaerota archaeon]
MTTQLLNSPAEILCRALVDTGAVTEAGAGGSWPCHYAEEPDGPGTPDDVVTLYDTQGRIDGYDQHFGGVFEHHGFQVKVRSNTIRKGWRKADQLLQTLARDIYLKQVNIESSSYLIHSIGDVGPILSLGKEPNTARRVWTINGTITIRLLT